MVLEVHCCFDQLGGEGVGVFPHDAFPDESLQKGQCQSQFCCLLVTAVRSVLFVLPLLL